MQKIFNFPLKHQRSIIRMHTVIMFNQWFFRFIKLSLPFSHEFNNDVIKLLTDKFKQSKPDEFFHDFELYVAPRGNGQPSTVGLQLPDIFQVIGQESGPSFAFKGSKSAKNQNKTQTRVHEVTKNLISIYKQKRMKVFHSMARTQAALRSKEFFQIYLTPSESIAKKKVYFKSKFHVKGKQKPFDYKLEYERLRGLKESEEELVKVQAYIDKMIEKNIKKMEAEKRKKQGTLKPIVEEKSPYTTLTELVSFSCQVESIKGHST